MTSHFTPPTPCVPAGAAPVGLVTELDPMSLLAVLYLRVWCDTGLTEITRDLRLALGDTHGKNAATAFEALCQTLLATGRRPFMRHGSGCKCLGGDEACFAQLISAAALGEREDALMLAMLMVRPDCAPHLVDLAQTSGLALQRMHLRHAHGSVALH